MEWKNFCLNIQEILELDKYRSRVSYEFDTKEIRIEYKLSENRIMKFSYDKVKYEKLVDGNFENNKLNIYNKRYYEVPITLKNEPLQVLRYSRIKGHVYDDSENKFRYIIDEPSESFLLKMVNLKVKSNVMLLIRRIMFNERSSDLINDEDKTIFDLLRILYKDCITIQITSEIEKTMNYFQSLVDSFIFNINYNTDVGIRQTYEFEEIYERRKNIKFRNEEFDDINSPKRIYKKELVEQYNMASISDDPFIKYLCYYHILEHFYENVYKEELVRLVREQMTLPDFSVKKNKEIIKLIDIIKDKLRVDQENFNVNELEALLLVLKKFTNIEKLKEKIKDIDVKLYEYYDKEKVLFSQGVAINFNDIEDNVYKNIAKRIYITRNSLVHYKSNDLNVREKRSYRVFDDKKELLKEISLIRILAEEVIIKNSEIL